MLAAEFGAQPRVYWERAIANGLVSVNGQQVATSYRLRNGDKLRHLAHRHEPCVFGDVTLVGETSDLIAVCKPASMPMHPCGAYNHNTLSKVLEVEPVVENQPSRLFFVHRLDRVTSGLVVVAKGRQVAGELSRQIRQNCTKKVYLARVKGAFPGNTSHLRQLEPSQLTQILRDDADDDDVEAGSKRKLGGEVDGGGGKVDWLLVEDCGFGWRGVELVVRVPLRVVSHREGVHECHPKGKPSMSGFRSLGYCAHSDTSLVECRLYTGRTHQLRLHLQLLGSPIANDPCYGGELFFGRPDRRLAAKEVWRAVRAAGMTPLCKAPHLDLADVVTEESDAIIDPSPPPEREEGEGLEEYVCRSCRYCAHPAITEQGKEGHTLSIPASPLVSLIQSTSCTATASGCTPCATRARAGR